VFQGLTFDCHTMPPLATTNGETGIAVETINPLVIGLNTFSPNQSMQAVSISVQ
jgi:hypothetical protein